MPVSSSNFTRTTSSTSPASAGAGSGEPHCHSCGASYNKPTAKFCSRCGTKKMANTSATPSPRQPASNPQNHSHNHNTGSPGPAGSSSGMLATRTSNNKVIVPRPGGDNATKVTLPSAPVSGGAVIPNALTRLNSTGGLSSHLHPPATASAPPPPSSTQRRLSNLSNGSVGGDELNTPDAAGSGRNTLRPSDNTTRPGNAFSRGIHTPTTTTNNNNNRGTNSAPMPSLPTTSQLGTKPGSTRRSFVHNEGGSATSTSPSALDASHFNTKKNNSNNSSNNSNSTASGPNSPPNMNNNSSGSGSGTLKAATSTTTNKDEVYKSIKVEPTPAQEQKYSAWATLGPKGLTPEMLMTENAEELAGWKKGTLIGRGTYGSVYLGLLADGSFYAVKCVELGKEATEAINPAELVSLSREINMMQRLQHKNLCEFKGVWYDPEERHMCMFMQYIGGGSLTSFVKKFKPLPPDVVRGWTKQLLSGLLYLHSQHIIHRDIKGENVLVDTSADPASGAQIKLVDFGAARRLTDAVSHSKTVIGTPYWMAPEVVDFSGEGGGYSYKADVWSVGCTVAEMLTGSPPWPTRANAPSTIMMIATSKDGPTEIPEKEATPGCLDFMKKCFVRDPEKRPTVEELLHHPWILGDME